MRFFRASRLSPPFAFWAARQGSGQGRPPLWQAIPASNEAGLGGGRQIVHSKSALPEIHHNVQVLHELALVKVLLSDFGLAWNSGMAVQHDGRIIIAVSFIEGRQEKTRLVRIFPDGKYDISYANPVFNYGYVGPIASLSDGSILVVLEPQSAAPSLVRITPDGVQDSTYSPPSLIASTWPISGILALLVDDENRAYLGGAVTNVGGKTWTGVVRLNEDGSHDETFVVPDSTNDIRGGRINHVLDLDFLADGSLLVTGERLLFKIRKNGETDPLWQGPRLMPLSTVVTKEAIYVLPNVFSGAQPIIWKLFHDGRIDPSLSQFARNILNIHPRENGLMAVGVDASYFLHQNGAIERPLPIIESHVTASAVQADGRLLIAADYDDKISRVNADGLIDETFQAPAMSSVIGILARRNGKILAWGEILTNSLAQRVFWQLLPDGSIDPNWPVHHSGQVPVGDAIELADGSVISVGQGAMYRLKPDGSPDPTFNGLALWWWNMGSLTTGGLARKFLSLPDGRFYVSGMFTQVGKVSGEARVNRGGLARFHADGQIDLSFETKYAEGTDWSNIRDIALQPYGKILVAGQVLHRRHPNGSFDSSFKTVQTDGFINAVHLEADGSIVIGGDFTRVNNQSRLGIARIHGDAVARPVLRISGRSSGVEVVVSGLAGVMTLEESSDLRAWHYAGTTNSSSSGVRFEILNSPAVRFFRVRQGD